MRHEGVRILDGVGHGFWMPKLRVVELRICDAWREFGRWVEPFVSFGLPLGYSVFFAMPDAGHFALC